MNNDHMILRAKELAAKAINEAAEDLFVTPIVTPKDMYVVWFSKTLQNWKALVSTDVIHKTYVEVTHNGDKSETYCDVYKRQLNVHFSDRERI